MRCAKCQRQIRDGGHASPLGERVCGDCRDILSGTTLGMQSGSNLGAGSPLAGAVVGGGMMRWLRRALGGRKERGSTRGRAPEGQDEGGSSW